MQESEHLAAVERLVQVKEEEHMREQARAMEEHEKSCAVSRPGELSASWGSLLLLLACAPVVVFGDCGDTS